MRLRKPTTGRRLALLMAVPAGIACGGGPPAADSATSASPVASDSTTASDSMPAGDIGPAGDSLPAADSMPARGSTPPRGSASAGSAHAASPARDAAPDTVRGIVAEVGSFPMISVVVQPRSGAPVTITGALAREIGRAAGAEVAVSGVRGPRSLEASSYAVRTVDGQAAVDGVLASDGDRLVLVTVAGRRPIARPLQALRGMIGARVWLVGPLDGTITSYGVLREP